MPSHPMYRTLVHFGLAAALLIVAGAGAVYAAGVVTTGFGSDQVLLYPTPNAELPNPEAIPASGVPADAHPQGVACFEPDTCLVSDSGHFRVFVVQVSTRSVVDTISTASAPYSGAGTIAVNPAKTFALAVDPFAFVGQITVIAAPFGSGSAISKISLAGSVLGGGTQNIAFGPTGRAFVCAGGSIAVVDPPYTAIAFTLPSGCSELAVSPDGNTLLAPLGKNVSIFTAPFTAGSSPATLSIPLADTLAGVAVTSDNAMALVVDVSGAIWAVSAPFTGSSAVEKISFPAGLSFPRLRQIAISPDATLAIVAGGDGTNPHVAFVRPPFTTGGATVFDVFIAGGVGIGGATFLGPAGPPGPPPPPCGPITVSATLGALEANPTPQAVGVVPLAAAVLPSSRSVRVGCPATAFVTVINAGTETATGVSIAPATPTPLAAGFLYQTTDRQTNALTGTPNTPADIPVGQLQTYLIAITPRASLAPTDVTFSFGGTNTTPTPPLIGINTLLLSASPSTVPDLIALAATLGGNGIVDIPGPTGTGAFAVASVNVGLGATMTVSADTGGVALPVTILVCQTDAMGGCAQLPAASVTTFINGGATPTFSFFVVGGGAVSFDPAQHRVFVRFKDAQAITRGSTSVAVRTVP